MFLGAHLKKYGLHIIDATSYKLQVGILSALIGVTAVFGVLSGNWGKHALWLAILEWTMIFLIMIWNCSFYKVGWPSQSALHLRTIYILFFFWKGGRGRAGRGLIPVFM